MAKDHDGPWIGLMVSRDMMAELGHFIAQWGFMETYLNMLILRLLAKPQSESEMQHLPMALKKRSALLRDTARSLFQSCPSLVERIERILAEIAIIKRDREAVAHGMWASANDGSVRLTNFRNGKWSTTTLTLDRVKAQSVAVSALSRRIMAILNAGSVPGTDWAFPLSSHEITTIQTFVYRTPLPPHTPSKQ